MRSEKLTFRGAGGETLAGRLDLPDAPPAAYALFAHCFTCTKDIYAAARIARELTEAGIGVLRFDFTGLGHSEGEFANTDFSSNVGDLIAAADHLRTTGRTAQILIGHSLGGAAVLAAAGAIADARGVVTIGAPADPEHVSHLFKDAIAEIRDQGEAEVMLAGRSFRIKRSFLEDIESHALAGKIGDLKRALLVLHAPLDEMVAIDNAAAIFLAAKHPKSFVSLDDADHLLTRRRDAEYVARLIAAWAGRYIEPEALPANEIRANEGEVIVSETGEGKFTQSIAAGRHHLRADEPEEVGGNDSAPSPYDLLLAALGACTSMTLRLYAEHKKLPLERVTVRLRHAKIHARDCAECETKEGKIDRIDRVIQLDGPLSPEARQRMLEIADRCPVHQTLSRENQIVSELAPGDSRPADLGPGDMGPAG